MLANRNLNLKVHLLDKPQSAQEVPLMSRGMGIAVAFETVCEMHSTTASLGDTLASTVDIQFRSNAPRRCSDT